MREEEFELLSEYIEALIEQKIAEAYASSSAEDRLRTSQLRQDAINVICFGEELEK